MRSAAVYARISSDQEGAGLGVGRQVQDCRALAERLGWPVGEVYEDNDFSAYSGKRRPAYVRMLDDLRDGTRDAVIVYHVDRLTRRPIELEEFVATLDAARIRHVRFVVGDSDMMTGDGLMVIRMLSAVAANESATKSRRIRRKNEQRAAAGLPHAGGSRARPFGYERDKVTIREDEAAVVRTLVERFCAGESLRSLTVWLDAQGVRTICGGLWKTQTLRTLITSPRIAGLREHREQVGGPAVWEGIITPEQRDEVLAVMSTKQITGRRAPRRYLLSGLLRCGKCGNRLYSAARQSTRRYVCQKGPDHGGCGQLSVVAPPVEQLIADAVLIRLASSEFSDALAGRAAASAETAQLAEQVTADRAQLDELADLYAARTITAAEWARAREGIDTDYATPNDDSPEPPAATPSRGSTPATTSPRSGATSTSTVSTPWSLQSWTMPSSPPESLEPNAWTQPE
ncbi:hypothetical protein N798_09300 [Knoellia flava TL1]|uniref:Serine recombinase n=1 Tax=Knoellia flava TL1 TaxID=1385518 RepID=A0ABR4XDJ0_9MICO|nr:hypothetical protein N798_09300 [Knoellia flava TL1]